MEDADASHRTVDDGDSTHRCTCGATFDTAEELLQHARDAHDATV
jgi:hypothetical protein